jgi:hypothetical protein
MQLAETQDMSLLINFPVCLVYEEISSVYALCSRTLFYTSGQ